MHPLLVNNSQKLFIPEPSRKIIHEDPSKESKMAYKKQINFCISLKRKCRKDYLKKLTKKGLTSNNSFWKFMNPFLTSKGFIRNNDITLL